MTDSQQLLAEYARNGSDAAFRELVTRYVDLVYSTALRLVEGDTHRAEDVAQTVFVDLARLARTLSHEVMPGGWLHRHTCFVAANTMRGERRRQSRERQAVEMNVLQTNSRADLSQIAPLLDEAINELGEADRTAILLRFFEQHDFRSVGQVLGSNEDAARMRVTRALEKLETLLKRRGITASSGALAVVLGTNAVQAAPVALAASVSAAALASAASGGGLTLALINFMAITKLKIAVGAVVVAGIGTTVVLQHQTQAGLRAENEVLKARISQSAARVDENQRLSNLPAPADTAASQLEELLRLRREAALLREQKQERDKSQTESRRSRSQPGGSNAGSLSPNERWPNVIRDLPKESWTYAGYADPDTAFQSFLWASNSKDAEAILNSCVPEVRQEAKTKQEQAKMVEIISGNVSRWKGVQVLEKQTPANDQVHLVVDILNVDGRDSIIKMKLRRVGNEWKFAGEGPVE
jgi:RNA polymerase sigma factor (sigma-70 family)